MSSWREKWQNLWQRLNILLLFASQSPRTSHLTVEGISPEYLDIWLEILEAEIDSESDPQVVYPILQKYQDQLDLEFAETLSQWFHSQLDPDDIEKNKDLARNLNNFAKDICRFPLGSRANNLEIAIVACRAALEVRTRTDFPEDWATTQNNLGNAYQTRIRRERADNIESGIGCYQAALEVITRTAFPEDWARTQMGLGEAYRNRIRRERADNIESGIGCYQAALEVITRTAFPEDWARTQMDLGNAYQTRIRGERADNIESAIRCYQAALEVFTRTAFPYEWATTQMNLGSAYQTRIRGERAENIESAIRCYQAALEVFTRTAFPYEWATTQMNLGSAYSDRIQGERADNIESAIRWYQAALEVYTRTAFPEDWARTQMGLGNAYSNRIRGKGANNIIKEAIGRFQDALEYYSRMTFPEKWPATQNNLATAYQISFGVEEANNIIGKAIRRFRTDFPEDWARAKNNFAIVYSNRIRRERADNIEEAIRCYEAALEVFTRTAFPEYWATTQINLGSAYYDRIRGERADNIESAIGCHRAALEVFTRTAFPEYWATTQINLGLAYWSRIRGERADNIESAIRCYQSALEVCTPSSFPLYCLQTGRNLGNLGYDLQNWEIAIEGYDNAIRAVEQSRDWATSPDTKRQIMEDALPLYGKMIQACIHLERYEQALLTVDRSKSRTLMEMLTSADLVPKNATPEQQEQYRQLNREIAALQQSFAPTENPTDGKTGTPGSGEIRGNRELATATEARGTTPLQSLLQQRQTLLAEINDPAFNAFQTVRPQLPDFRQLLTPETALIEWYLPQDPNLGAWAFTVTLDQDRPHIDVYCYSADQRQRLDQFNQTYFADYRQASWYQALGDRLDDLTEYLHLSDIIAPLPPICQRLILIPHLYLHLFPLHALSVDLNAPATPLLERFSQGVSYAPSCQILDYLHHRPQPATAPQFFAVQNPTEDLSYAQMEVEFIRPYFDPNCYILSQEAATKSALNRLETLEKLRESHLIHFSCHGAFDGANPLNSAIILAGDAPPESPPTEKKRQTLTLRNGRCFDTAQQGLTLGEIYRNLDIPACRLVMLSACETGLMGSLLTDEYIGLASGFLYAGTPTVVSSLWCVDDFATACLAIRFYYEFWKDARVVMALHKAQNWLREVSAAGFLEWCSDGLKMTEEECDKIDLKLMDYHESCPFGDWRYW
ncbi:CHAT domain-containing protein [Limnospira fusiformis]|uniref:CHAT domain-containing protein n=1 Tax=Limnospira fusiformis TaxID=54297 RepID=UPI0034E08A90